MTEMTIQIVVAIWQDRGCEETPSRFSFVPAYHRCRLSKTQTATWSRIRLQPLTSHKRRIPGRDHLFIEFCRTAKLHLRSIIYFATSIAQ